MSWKWNAEPLGKDKCSMCQQALRVQGDGGVVIWTDSNHYHVWVPVGSVGFRERAAAEGDRG